MILTRPQGTELNLRHALKARPWDASRLVSDIFRWVDCSGECKAKCCRVPGISVAHSDPNFERIMQAVQAARSYDHGINIKVVSGGVILDFESGVCTFLDTHTNQCRIYDIRPSVCRMYPMLPFWTAVKGGDTDSNWDGRVVSIIMGCPTVRQLVARGIDVLTINDLEVTPFLRKGFQQLTMAKVRKEIGDVVLLDDGNNGKLIPVL